MSLIEVLVGFVDKMVNEIRSSSKEKIANVSKDVEHGMHREYAIS